MSAHGRGGYGLGLALRHGLAGALRPRAAMREALAAGLGERARLTLFAASYLAFVLPYPVVRSALDDYASLARANDAPTALAVGLLLAMLLVLALVLYAIACGAVGIVLRLLHRPDRGFAATRSAVAVGAWIATLPVAVVHLLAFALAPTALGPAGELGVGLATSILAGTYGVLCLAEAQGTGLPRAAAVVVLAAAGASLAVGGLIIALDWLTAIVGGSGTDHTAVEA